MKLKKGELIIFPTDTVYGLGALIDDSEGQKKIFSIKERALNKRLAVLCGSIEQVKNIASVSFDAEKLAKAFWPGALTLILPINKKTRFISDIDTIGVRIPNHPLALALLNENGPMATSSVNKSGSTPLNDINIIRQEFSRDVNYILSEEDGQYLNVSSTIVDMTVTPAKILRIGSISEKEIFTILGINE